MRRFRMILVALVLLNAALTVVYLEATRARLRYEAVERENLRWKLALETRVLERELAEASRPEALEERAAALGLNLRPIRHLDLTPSGPEEGETSGRDRP